MPQLNLDHASMLRPPGYHVQRRVAQMIDALKLLLRARLSSWRNLFYWILELFVAITVCLLGTNQATAQTVARPRAIDRPPNTSGILPLATAPSAAVGVKLVRDEITGSGAEAKPHDIALVHQVWWNLAPRSASDKAERIFSTHDKNSAAAMYVDRTGSRPTERIAQSIEGMRVGGQRTILLQPDAILVDIELLEVAATVSQLTYTGSYYTSLLPAAVLSGLPPTTPTTPTNQASQTSQAKQASQGLTGVQLARDAYDKGDYPVSFREYSTLAKNDNNLEAQQWLGFMYESGLGVAKNDKAAEIWYKKAAEQAGTRALDPGSMTSLGWLYGMGKAVPKDQRKAMAWYEKAAASGFARAQNYLGLSYRDGYGVAQDYKQAVSWFRKAAEQDNAVGQFNLAWMYQNGKGIAQDDKQTVSWYRAAAEQGNADAQTNLGWMFENGRGVAKDDKQAVAWYRKAADQGNAGAQTNLGWMFENGRGVAKDDKQAFAWYRKAADQGQARAQNNLGWMYQNGKGVAKDERQSVSWYGKAAEQGNIEAMKALSSYYGSNNRKLSLYWLGEAAKNGDAESKKEFEWMSYRTAESDAAAIARLKTSAAQGDPEAQGRLGWLYSDGRGIPKNPKLAVYWFNKAIADHDDAKALFSLGSLYYFGTDVPKDRVYGYSLMLLSADKGFSTAITITQMLRPGMESGAAYSDTASENCPQRCTSECNEYASGSFFPQVNGSCYNICIGTCETQNNINAHGRRR